MKKIGDELTEFEVEEQEIQKYSLSTVFAHWILIISVFTLVVSGGLPLLNRILNFINLIDYRLPTIPYQFYIHNIFGFFLVFAIIFVIFTHSINLKDILGGQVSKDLGGFLRSFIYLIGLEKKIESGASKRFYAYQRIFFILIIFCLWVQIFSGLMLFFNPSSGSDISRTFLSPIQLLHYIGTLLLVFVLVYHILMSIRRFDKISYRCIFISGKLPLWYIKKNHKLWYEELAKNKESRKPTTRNGRIMT